MQPFSRAKGTVLFERTVPLFKQSKPATKDSEEK